MIAIRVPKAAPSRICRAIRMIWYPSVCSLIVLTVCSFFVLVKRQRARHASAFRQRGNSQKTDTTGCGGASMGLDGLRLIGAIARAIEHLGDHRMAAGPAICVRQQILFRDI